MGIREGGRASFFYRFKGGRDQKSLRTTALIQPHTLNKQQIRSLLRKKVVLIVS